MTAVRFDFTNYDAEPPSVRFVDPFSGRLLANKDLPIRLLRMLSGTGGTGTGCRRGAAGGGSSGGSLPDDLPFLCIAGVKEYHNHPGHTGDPWELHRSAGEGRLVRLLEVVSKYGLEPVSGLGVNLSPQISFARSEPPR